MRQDVQRAAIGAAEQYLQRPLGHVDAPGRLAVRGVDEYLAIGDEHAAIRPARHTLATAIGEWHKVGEGAAAPSKRCRSCLSDSLLTSTRSPGLAAMKPWPAAHPTSASPVHWAALDWNTRPAGNTSVPSGETYSRGFGTATSRAIMPGERW